jgi:hypothetical protein
MNRIADSIYDRLEAEWEEAHPDAVLQETEIPATALAEVDEEEPTERFLSQTIIPTRSHPWNAVTWRPGLSGIHEAGEDELESPIRGSRRLSEKIDPIRKISDSTVSTLGTPISGPDDSPTTSKEEADIITNLQSPDQLPIIYPQGRRRSSIAGTSNWEAPQSIHYRVWTRSAAGSVSGASLQLSEVEVESLNGDKVLCQCDPPNFANYCSSESPEQ